MKKRTFSKGAMDAFKASVENLGGMMLPAPCKGKFLVRLNVVTCECGNASRATLPTGDQTSVIVCAVCDCAFDMPRIRGAAK